MKLRSSGATQQTWFWILLRDNDIDRIILCSHGRTGVSRWVHGNVARKVLEAADRTVVLVRAGLPKGA